MTRRALLLLTFCSIALALALPITGGFVSTMLGVRVSARSPAAAATLATAALALWAFQARRQRSVAADLIAVDSGIAVHALPLVAAIAGVAAATTIYFATFSASGADASGYLSEAVMWQHAQLERIEPLAAIAGGDAWRETLAPLGWRPAHEADKQVPTYAAGLPLLMAPLHAVGGTLTACLIVPIAFAAAVWAAGVLAHRVAGPSAAVVAAAWFASSPIALISAMQPMSDVPAAAAWLLAWVMLLQPQPARLTLRRIEAAGAFAAAAILIRPNLAPLVLVPALQLFAAGTGTSRPARFARVAAFSVPAAFAVAVVAYLQWRWFGSPLRSGYGTAEEIYALSNVAPNAVLYTRWLIETHGVWVMAAPLAALVIPGRPIRWLLAFAAAVCVAYFVYAVFEVWTYLRFLLPAIAIAVVALASLIAQLLTRAPQALRGPAVAILVLALVAFNVRSARQHDVFRVADGHARAALAGHYLAAVVPGNAVVIAGEQSGAVRYYTGRSIVRWDVAIPDAFAIATERLHERGYDIWIALDEWEEELFRRKFPDSRAGPLDWPPIVDAGTGPRTRAWRLRDRERFMRGERVITDRLR